MSLVSCKVGAECRAGAEVGAEETLAQQRQRGDLGPASLRQQPLATPLYPSSSIAQSNATRALSSVTLLSARTGTWQMLQGKGQWHYLKPGPWMKSLPSGLRAGRPPPGLASVSALGTHGGKGVPSVLGPKGTASSTSLNTSSPPADEVGCVFCALFTELGRVSRLRNSWHGRTDG